MGFFEKLLGDGSPKEPPPNLGDHLWNAPIEVPAAWAPPSDEKQVVEQRLLSNPMIKCAMCMAIPELCGIYFMFWMASATYPDDVLRGEDPPPSVFMIFFAIMMFSPIMAFFFCVEMYSPLGQNHVWACLKSMKTGIAHDVDAAALFEKPRHTCPQITFNGTASISDLQGTRTTFSHTWFFKYNRCRDLSGTITGLEKYSLARISVSVSIEAADEETKQALQSCGGTILEYVRLHHYDETIRCTQMNIVECGDLKVEGETSMITRSPGTTQPFWMNRCVYFLCHMCCFGWLYRLCFAMRVPNIVYHVRKEIRLRNKSQWYRWGIDGPHE